MKRGKIPHRLLQSGLRQLHSGRLAFHNHQRSAVLSKNDGIATLVKPVDLDGILHGKQTRRHLQMLHQKIKHLLPHLFLGGEFAIQLPQGIEDQRLTPLNLGLKPLKIRHDTSFLVVDAVQDGL